MLPLIPLHSLKKKLSHFFHWAQPQKFARCSHLVAFFYASHKKKAHYLFRSMLHFMAQPSSKNIVRFFLSFITLHSFQHFRVILLNNQASFIRPFHKAQPLRLARCSHLAVFFNASHKKKSAICSAPCFTLWLSLIPFPHSFRHALRGLINKKIFFCFPC